MFSTTAYEALFTYLGLHLHSTSIDIITSQGFFAAILMLIFGASFLLLCFKYASKYVPGGIIYKKSIPLSVFVKLIFSLFIGITILKVDSNINVSRYDYKSWHSNPYLLGKLPDVEDSYKVSYLFKLLARSSEELTKFASVIVDKMFVRTNSQLKAPDYFYKAIMVTASATIENEALRKLIHIYTNACFQKVLPLVSESANKDFISKFFENGSEIDSELRKIPVKISNKTFTCYTIKNDINKGLRKEGFEKAAHLIRPDRLDLFKLQFDKETIVNKWGSNALANFYLNETKGPFGLHKGSMLPSGAATAFQMWGTSFYTKILHILGLGEYSGASMAGERAVKFSEMLKRAPHVKGIAKMILILLFPWMIFLLAAGKWKSMIFWFAMYTSVCLWTPIWTFFYHIMTNIALSNDVVAHFGDLNKGISLYGSKIISSKLYTFYAVYSWVQILSGPIPTTILGFYLSPLLKDTEQDDAPEVVSVAKTAVGYAAGGPAGGAAGAASGGKKG